MTHTSRLPLTPSTPSHTSAHIVSCGRVLRMGLLSLRSSLLLPLLVATVPSAKIAQAVEHPSLVIRADNYAELRARASQPPWSNMKVSAITTASNAAYNPGDSLQERLEYVREITGAAALAFILDPDNAATYRAKLLDALDLWSSLYADRGTYHFRVTGSAAFFNSVLALDVIHDDLSAVELAAAEAALGRVGDWWYGATGQTAVYRHAAYGIWSLYKGDAQRIAQATSGWREAFLSFMTPDGIFTGGPGYAADSVRFRLAKMDFHHVLEFTGQDSWYSDPAAVGFHEWLYGAGHSPSHRHPSFGDTGLNRNYCCGLSTFVAHRFSLQAGENAAWQADGSMPPGRLLFYVLMDQPRPATRKPRSQIWHDGCAAFWEDSPSNRSLMGILWSPISAGGASHQHKEVNALYAAAYGEHVLRNAGYLGWDVGAHGFPWSWVHDDDRSANTLRIAGTAHASKVGGGISEGLTTSFVDYASASSGSALPNGHHQRNYFFVHPQSTTAGYFVAVDEVSSEAANERVNIAWHPNADNCTAVDDSREYESLIGPFPQSSHAVSLTVFLGTDPTSVRIADGLLARMPDEDASFVGKYLDVEYRTDLTRKASIVTVLFPHDDEHAKASMAAINNVDYSGVALDFPNDIKDTVLSSFGEGTIQHEGVSFAGRVAVYRQRAGIVEFLAVRSARSFHEGGTPERGFTATNNISMAMQARSGVIVSSGANVTFYDPEASGLSIDGAAITPSAVGDGWLQAWIEPGEHHIELTDSGPTNLVAWASADLQAGEAPLAVSFTGGASGGSPPYGYEWSFGDGEVSNLQNPSHVYAQPGRYQARLTVTDDGTSTATDSVEVVAAEPGTTVFSQIPHFGDSLNYEPRVGSRWQVVNDEGDLRYFLSATNYEGEGDRLGEYALIRNRLYADFTLSFVAKSAENLSTNPNADFCTVFAWQDADNYYYAMFHTYDCVLFRVEGGVRTEVGRRLLSVDLSRYETIEISRRGDTIAFSLDDQEVLSVADGALGPGAIGVGSFNDAVYFDDIAVTGVNLLDGQNRDGGDSDAASGLDTTTIDTISDADAISGLDTTRMDTISGADAASGLDTTRMDTISGADAASGLDTTRMDTVSGADASSGLDTGSTDIATGTNLDGCSCGQLATRKYPTFPLLLFVAILWCRRGLTSRDGM